MPRGEAMFSRAVFAVLTYHEVGHGDGKWVTRPEELSRQLDLLRAGGGTFVSTSEAVAAMRGEGRLPPKALCVHFDDARAGVLRHGAEVLRRRNVPAAVFVVSGWASGAVPVPADERYSEVLGWEELRELRSLPGWEVGAHGRSHRSARRLGRKELREEVVGARREIEAELGTRVRHFSSPYNRVTPALRRAVKAAGYDSLFVGGGRPNGWLSSPYRVRRILVVAGFGAEEVHRVLGAL